MVPSCRTGLEKVAPVQGLRNSVSNQKEALRYSKGVSHGLTAKLNYLNTLKNLLFPNVHRVWFVALPGFFIGAILFLRFLLVRRKKNDGKCDPISF